MSNELLGADVWSLLAEEMLRPTSQVGLHATGQLARYVQTWNRGGKGNPVFCTVNECVEWTPVDVDPYATADELFEDWDRQAGATTFQLKVLQKNLDRPGWSKDDHVRYRAWHDSLHVRFRLDFTPDHELVLFGKCAKFIASDPTVSYLNREQVTRALFVHSIGVIAQWISCGHYPDSVTVSTLGPVSRKVIRQCIALADGSAVK